MLRTSWNDGWQFGPLVSVHEAIRVAAPSENVVTLPHDALLADGRAAEGSGGPQNGYFLGGRWSYEKQFDAPEVWERTRVAVQFEGVYRDATVYVNGAFAGQWANGYSGFLVDITPFLNFGQSNTIRVDAQAGDDSRWYSGGGIYRPVHLIVGDLVRVVPQTLRISTPDLDSDLATVITRAEIVNDEPITRTLDVRVDITDGDGVAVAGERGRITLRSGETLPVQLRAYIREPRLWDLDTPNLYTATITVSHDDDVLDADHTTFGVRSLSVDPVRGLRLNGRTVKLRGAAVHHDNGILGAAEFADAALRRAVKLKAAGFNAVRSSHNPLSVAMLDACDRLGLLVMDEAFDMWTVPKSGDDYSRRFPEWWERDIDALVAKDFNHPSVIIYSIGNEIIEAGTTHGARWGRLLAERVRALDPTRITTHALQGMYIARDKIPELRAEVDSDSTVIKGLNDYLGQVTQLMERVMASDLVGERLLEPASTLDVVGLNYGDSRYAVDRTDFPNRVYFGSESFPTRIDEIWRIVTDNDNVLGDFTWTGWDFLGEVGTGRHVYPEDAQVHRAPYPWIAAVCGDIDLIGDRKPMSFYREVVFGLTDVPYVAARLPRADRFVIEPKAWTWSDVTPSWTWETAEETPIHVEAYSTGDEVAFILNGEEVSRGPVGQKRPFLIETEIPYRVGTLEAVAYRNGTELARNILATAGAASHIRIDADSDELRGGSGGLVHLEISLVDESGVRCFGPDTQLEVSLTGPAVLQGLGSANPVTEDDFRSSETMTYRGRALAVIRGTGAAGPITVTVHAVGYPDTIVSLAATGDSARS
ncbi:glycoside hydrolase family 2 TIM barrel-domain containing protein [Microbacterium radiodurans]|uniref:Glycoside hydrolase family 2 protein n=1 Tax=Microbacterium radiodurans TaxID=661398 RepID=A0A5J5IWG6_9MICO|nr:glycoside hydrolase family 2 TIM barrel-domain containing protein [Microbacterium radiodurans]KAA9089172.1 glycoside hydrolase family 2 protein [Microbacterium radiodurans]